MRAIECFRLQGINANRKFTELLAKLRAFAGSAMCVPVVTYILRQIEASLPTDWLSRKGPYATQSAGGETGSEPRQALCASLVCVVVQKEKGNPTIYDYPHDSNAISDEAYREAMEKYQRYFTSQSPANARCEPSKLAPGNEQSQKPLNPLPSGVAFS